MHLCNWMRFLTLSVPGAYPPPITYSGVLWSSLAKVYFRNQSKGISATDWPRSIHGRAAGEHVTHKKRPAQSHSAHFHSGPAPAEKVKTVPKYRSDLMFHPWKCLWTCPRNGCWVLTKRTLTIVVKLVICILWLEHSSHSQAGSWASLSPEGLSAEFPTSMWEAEDRAPRLSMPYLKKSWENYLVQNHGTSQYFLLSWGPGITCCPDHEQPVELLHL